MLCQSSNLGVDCDFVAKNALQTNRAGVPLNSAEKHGHGEAVDLLLLILEQQSVAEGLVGSDLMKAVQVLNKASALSSGSVSEETEDGVLDLENVVELQELLGGGEKEFVRELLRNLGGGIPGEGSQDGGGMLHDELDVKDNRMEL